MFADTTITLSVAGTTDRSILMFIPAVAFPNATAGAKGKLIVIREDDAPTELGLTLIREDYGPFVKAFLWFWGVFVPAAIVSGLGITAYSIQKTIDARSSENETLERFRRAEANNLTIFFEGLYRNRRTSKSSDEFKASMERDLTDKGIWAALPRKVRERILKALKLDDRDKVDEQLAKAFPENAETILKSSSARRPVR